MVVLSLAKTEYLYNLNSQVTKKVIIYVPTLKFKLSSLE